jgi:hypothetical protein
MKKTIINAAGETVKSNGFIYGLDWVMVSWVDTHLKFVKLYHQIGTPFFFSFLLCAGYTLWHLQKFLQCIKYKMLEFTPFTILLYAPYPIPGIVSTSLIFPEVHISICQ